MPRTLQAIHHLSRIQIAGLIIAALVATALIVIRLPGNSLMLVAEFPDAKGIYVGDDVTLLGVRIGSITDIQPAADKVDVEMTIDNGVDLPADVRAAITAPALVTVRSVALGPAYSNGPRVESGDVIPLSRTSVPVEWDDVKSQLTRFARALGPRGANKRGAVDKLITSAAGFLNGNGATMNQTITDLAEATATLSDNKGDLFATVRNLQVFVAALEGSDRQIRTFNTRLDLVSAALAADRGAIGRALKGLRGAFIDVQRFLKDNKTLTISTLRELRSTTGALADNRQGLADILHLAPTTLSNFYNILDPRTGSLTGVLAAQNLNNPAQIICSAILNLNGHASDCAAALGPLVDFLKIDAPPTGLLPPLGVPRTTDNRQPGPAPSVLDNLLNQLPPGLLDGLVLPRQAKGGDR